MDPWYKIVTPRKEVREGRSFNPDEFAIALDQVVSGRGPEDYRDPEKFFSRTYFTKALTQHAGMVLRRLVGETANTAPVLTLVTQFGGGKTHTLTALYHLARSGQKAVEFPGVRELLQANGLKSVPWARVAVFVGNAWDPQDGKETPWIDLAMQLAGERGVALLGKTARTTPPGTAALGKILEASEGPALVLFDEVLNFVNRHRNLAEPFHAFLQNLTVAMTGTTHGAAVISLPRSQVEMTEWDYQWQEKITKVVRRVAKDLIALDEAEISEVVRRRLFKDLGSEKVRRHVAKVYANWCFERRAQLPPEWTAVDSAASEKRAREALQARFEACYPFHPSTLSVFQRKWQTLPQYQQTRGTLAMLAQWISWAYRDGFTHARREPLITLGSAPLEVAEFRSVVLGQLGESRLGPAIETDLVGVESHARALDVDTKGPLRDIHRRVGKVILFESSGGQVEKVAHLPELRFALGEPQVDTTTVDNAAMALESRAYYIRKVGTDGFRIHHKPTLKKVVSDRRASLDGDQEVKPEMLRIIKEEFEKGRSVPMIVFPKEGEDVPDSPRLTLVLLGPEFAWEAGGELKRIIGNWTRNKGDSPRLYPGALLWCARKPGMTLQEKIEAFLAWKKVMQEVEAGILGSEFEPSELKGIREQVQRAEEEAREEVWAAYRFLAVADPHEKGGIKAIDLGAGHSSASKSLCDRILTALRSQALLNDSVGAGYIDRNWPPALKEEGEWPLASLRQSFLNGTLTRLLDPDTVLKRKIAEFVERGDFALASGKRADGGYERVWFGEPVPSEEISFEPGVFLLKKARAESIKTDISRGAILGPKSPGVPKPGPPPGPKPITGPEPEEKDLLMRISGMVPPEIWNRLGIKFVPKLRSGSDLKIRVEFSVKVSNTLAESFESELRQILEDLGIRDKVEIVFDPAN